jgi:hypothetical protein
MQSYSRHTWEVKTEGAARISAVVRAREGQKRTGMENPWECCCNVQVGRGGMVRFGELREENDLSGRGHFFAPTRGSE